MRRALIASVLAALTLVTATACGNPPGTDGNLVNQWPAMTAAAGWEPKSGTCHLDFAAHTPRDKYNPIGCTLNHPYETVHIGQFAGAAANLSSPPVAGSPELAAAWTECDKKATEYLGGEWRDGRIEAVISTPSDAAWKGGVHWYRCDVEVRDHVGSVEHVNHSLKGEFAKDSDLKYGCFEIPADEKADWTQTACTASHNGEYVGAVVLTDSWASLKDNPPAVHNKCRSAIAGYAGVPDDGNVKYRTGSYYFYPTESEWNAGDHSVRCVMWQDTKHLTRSVKGAGNAGLPLN